MGGSTALPSPPTAGPVGKGQEVSVTTEESCGDVSRGRRHCQFGEVTQSCIYASAPNVTHTQYCPQVSCTAAPLHFLGLPQLGHDSTHTNVYMHVGNVVGVGGVKWEIISNATVPFLNNQVFKKLGMEKTLTTTGSHTHPSTNNVYKSLTVSPLAAPQPAPLQHGPT